MHVLNTYGLPIGEIVVIEADEDPSRVIGAGLPYVRRPGKMKDDAILKALLYPIIVSRFPYLIMKKPQSVHLVAPVVVHGELDESVRIGGSYGDSAGTEDMMEFEGGEIFSRDSYRYSLGGMPLDEDLEDDEAMEYKQVSLERLEKSGYLTVDTAELMDAGLLPKFLQDIGESIRANLSSYAWNDCFNRKLGAFIGEYQLQDERPNLMVLDISGSIPRGVAYTMVGLIDTLRTQANADLIVNSGSSQWWPHDQAIDVDEINKIIGGCNEAVQFKQILLDHVLGRKWGNVIGFGDWDAPDRKGGWRDEEPPAELFANTEVGNVVSYHTSSPTAIAGYLKWVLDCKHGELTCKPCSWVKQLKRW